jgi:hypothetical protein
MIVHASRADDLFVGLRKRGAASSLRLRARATREVESAKLSAFRLLCRRSQQRYPRAAIWGTFWRILRQVSTDRRGQSHSVGRGLAAVIGVAKKSEGDLFFGVIVPGRMRAALLKDIDDVLADVVGRLGPPLMKRRGR